MSGERVKLTSGQGRLLQLVCIGVQHLSAIARQLEHKTSSSASSFEFRILLTPSKETGPSPVATWALTNTTKAAIRTQHNEHSKIQAIEILNTT